MPRAPSKTKNQLAEPQGPIRQISLGATVNLKCQVLAGPNEMGLYFLTIMSNDGKTHLTASVPGQYVEMPIVLHHSLIGDVVAGPPPTLKETMENTPGRSSEELSQGATADDQGAVDGGGVTAPAEPLDDDLVEVWASDKAIRRCVTIPKSQAMHICDGKSDIVCPRCVAEEKAAKMVRDAIKGRKRS